MSNIGLYRALLENALIRNFGLREVPEIDNDDDDDAGYIAGLLLYNIHKRFNSRLI